MTQLLTKRLVFNVVVMVVALPIHVVHEASGAALDVLWGPKEDPWDYFPTTAGGPIGDAPV